MLIDKLTRDADYNADPRVSEINNPKNATFQITDTKLYVPVVTLSKENDIKLLEQLKPGFKKNYKMEQIQIANDNSAPKQQLKLFNWSDPTFTNINRLLDTPIQIIMYQKLKLMT